MPTIRSASVLICVAGLAAGAATLRAANAQAGEQGGAKSIAEPGATLDLPTARGVEPMIVDAPDAYTSSAHAAADALTTLRVRARVVIRAAIGTDVEGIVLAANPGVKAIAFAPGDGGAPLPGFWVADVPSVRDAAILVSALRADARLNEAFVETNRFTPRGVPSDPGLASQWFLVNPVMPQASTNVVPAWMGGFIGTGVTVGVVDEGFNTRHPDLSGNYNALASQTDQGFQDHGTSTAGLVAEVANNARGGAGVAYGARVSRLYYGFESDNAAAFLFHNELNAVKTNSWGPADIGTIYPMSSVELAALSSAVTGGRDGKGEVFVWACGNGAAVNSDRVDYDGYGSNRYSIAVGAIDNADRAALYSEPGAALMLVTTSSYDFAGSGGSGIYTSTGFDTSGDGSYTTGFGGTSAASPIAAGVVALMLQANPALTWRDVQHVLIRSARVPNPGDPGWVTNDAGHRVSYQYGFGAVDAGAAVALAQTITPHGPEIAWSSPLASVLAPIPDNSAIGVSSTIAVPINFSIERVQVVLNAPHQSIGDLMVELTAPSGTVSLLASPRNDFTAGYTGYTFTSVRHWDERCHGTWTLRITDTRAGGTGTFSSWQLKVFGSSTMCDADWNGHGLSTQDIFDFINDWFAGTGDFDRNGVVDIFDIYLFINSWFAASGC